jgi:hypothetical protein
MDFKVSQLSSLGGRDLEPYYAYKFLVLDKDRVLTVVTIIGLLGGLNRWTICQFGIL